MNTIIDITPKESDSSLIKTLSYYKGILLERTLSHLKEYGYNRKDVLIDFYKPDDERYITISLRVPTAHLGVFMSTYRVHVLYVDNSRLLGFIPEITERLCTKIINSIIAQA